MEAKKYSTDATMSKLWLHLVKDFRNVVGHEYAAGAEQALRAGIKDYRGFVWPTRATVAPYIHKMDAQLEHLYKRYRFEDDVFSDEELERITTEKFVATQERIATPLQITPIVDMVLRRARVIIAEILGDYDLEEHYASCRFGKRSCANVPYSRSYLDIKLGQELTGSKDHILWFKKYLESDRTLADVIGACVPNKDAPYEVCETLTMSKVPKSYKALRTVKPPTLIGSFYTYGLGRVIQKRLLKVKLNIRNLQRKHRKLVKLNSLTRKLVTADLSAASDSLTRELLRRLLPAKWYRVVMLGISPSVLLDGNLYGLQSVATMGDGHTFPLQTLVFYSLLTAIGDFVMKRSKCFVSVYGDDLIYSHEIHRYVKHVFPALHLILNEDKTYARDYYRESCGSDCYRGVDVRPYCFEGESKLYTAGRFISFIYKLSNGLRERWDECEIAQTLTFLEGEILRVTEKIHQVPPSFPEGAGWRVDRPRRDIFYEPVFFSFVQGRWTFKYLHISNNKRVVKSQFPYFWEALRQMKTPEVPEPWDHVADMPVLKWRKTSPPKYIRSKTTGRRLRRMEAVTLDKVSSKVVGQTGSTSCWN